MCDMKVLDVIEEALGTLDFLVNDIKVESNQIKKGRVLNKKTQVESYKVIVRLLEEATGTLRECL